MTRYSLPHPRTPKKGSVLQFGAEIHSIWLKAGADRLGRGSARVHSNLDIFGRLGIYICYIFSQNHYYATPHAQRAPEGDYGLIRSAINWAESHPCSGFPPHPRLLPHHNRPFPSSLSPSSFLPIARQFFPAKIPNSLPAVFREKGLRRQRNREREREGGEPIASSGGEKEKRGGNTEESKNIVWSGIRIYGGGDERERVSGITAKKYRRSTEKIRILAVTTGGWTKPGTERAGCWPGVREKEIVGRREGGAKRERGSGKVPLAGFPQEIL